MSGITKSEAATRWGISPASVTKMLARGLPVRNDGMLDWEIADKWRRDNVVQQKSGSFRSRQRANQSPVTGSPTGRSLDDFGRGYVAARVDLRECLPILIAVNGDVKTLSPRIHEFLKSDALLGRWAELNGITPAAGELPDVDWSVCSAAIQKLAGKIQREVDAEFAALRARSL